MSIAIGDAISSISFSDFEAVLPYKMGLMTFVDELVEAYYEHRSSISVNVSSDSIIGMDSTYIYFALFAMSVAFLRVLATSYYTVRGYDLPGSELSESVASLVDFDGDSRFY